MEEQVEGSPEDFLNNLESMKPTRKLRGADDESAYLDLQAALPGASAKVPISLSDDENENGGRNLTENSDVSNKSPKKKRKINKTPSRQEGSDSASTDFRNLKITFGLDPVREYLAEDSQSRVSVQIEPRVIDTTMLTAIQRWEKPLQQFFGDLRASV